MTNQDDVLRELTGPEADAYADALSCLADIQAAHEAVHAILDSWPANSERGPDGIVPRALWRSALISYARAFGGGVRRYDAAAAFDRMPPEARASHDHFLTLRNMHIAHSINAQEQVGVGVALGPPPSFEVRGIGSLYASMTLAGRADTEIFDHLTSDVGRLVRAECAALEPALKALAQSMTPAERAALPAMQIVVPGVAQYRRSRRPRR